MNFESCKLRLFSKNIILPMVKYGILPSSFRCFRRFIWTVSIRMSKRSIESNKLLLNQGVSAWNSWDSWDSWAIFQDIKPILVTAFVFKESKSSFHKQGRNGFLSGTPRPFYPDLLPFPRVLENSNVFVGSKIPISPFLRSKFVKIKLV